MAQDQFQSCVCQILPKGIAIRRRCCPEMASDSEVTQYGYNARTASSNGKHSFVNRAIHLPAGKTLALAGSLLAALLFSSLPACGQELSISDVNLDSGVTVEQLEARIQSIEASDSVDAETRGKVAEQLRVAQTQVQNRLAAETAARAFAAALDTAPAEIQALRDAADAERPAAPTAESLGIDDGTTLSELEQWLNREIADLTDVESRLAELEVQLEIQQDRPALARERINQLRQSRDELVAAAEAPPAQGEPQILAEARKLVAVLKRGAQSAEINKLQQELLGNSASVNLLRARRDAADRTRLELERRVELLRGIVNDRRETAAMLAQQAAAEAELAATDKHPVVRELAVGNAGLTRDLSLLAAEIERVSLQLDKIRTEARTIEQRLARARQRLEVGGLSRAMGQLLVEERRNLPQVSHYRSQVRARSSKLADTGLAQVRVQEQARELTPLDAALEQPMAEVAGSVTDEQQLAEVQGELRRLLRDRRDLLLKADASYGNYLQLLGDLDIAQRRLLQLADDYEQFLDQNLLWTPSAPIVFTGLWHEAVPAAMRSVSLKSWLVATTTLAASLREHVTAAASFLGLLIVLLLLRRPLGRRYKTMSALVGRLSTDNIGLTLAALAIAAVRALPVPLLFVAISWFLENATESTAFTAAVASGLGALAPFLYNVLLFRVLSAPGGVLQIHFGWQKDGLAAIRRQLDRLSTFAAPLVFATVFFYSSDFASDRATMGRLAFVALMVVLTMTVRPLLHPESGIVASYYSRRPETWASKGRWVWYALATGGPLALGLISMLGYLYTSLILTGLLVDTIWLALALILVNLVVLRWLALTRRKIALKVALEQREAQKAERLKDASPGTEVEAPSATSTPLDLETVDQQTRKLLRSGLFFVAALAGWGIWAKVIPAFTRFDQVALWSQSIVVDGAEIIAPVTLADLLLAVLILAVTVVASRNLPGLMEIAILRHLTLQPGSRYATNTLVRYVVVTIGVFSVLNIIGWNWSQIQWLVAALSVGLGFGLQEIVANFVSGLVILFERPVRVGDTVTVGELTGTVSRVRIRATTITDWDRKEIIVPNKAFITEQVVNWTLSDPITRIVIPVGISYGSDVELAHRVMGDTLASLPLVLDEPPPKVYFIGFGDSSLDFKLYVFSRQLTDRLPLIHAVHEAVLKSLRQNGIEIPFPQRDLHIKTEAQLP
jgi:potassium efflux system protein